MRIHILPILLKVSQKVYLFPLNNFRCHIICCAKNSRLLLLLNRLIVLFGLLFLLLFTLLKKEGPRSLIQALGDKAFLSWLRKNKLFLHLPLRLQIEIVIVGHHILNKFFFLLSQEVLHSQVLKDVLLQLLISLCNILLFWLGRAPQVSATVSSPRHNLI